MGDKQQYLQQAVPDLSRAWSRRTASTRPRATVLRPVGSAGQRHLRAGHGRVSARARHAHRRAQHVARSAPRRPVRQRAPGIICDPTTDVTVNGTTFSNNNDDRGELLNRAGPAETPLADAGHVLLPELVSPNTSDERGQDAQRRRAAHHRARRSSQPTSRALIQGVGTFGCGIESQLESWYRFLVQPDPYDSLGPRRQRATRSGTASTPRSSSSATTSCAPTRSSPSST